MDPVETGVIIIVSVIIGGLVVGLIYDWEYQETYQDIKEKFDVIPYQKEIEKTTLNGLVNEVSEFQDFAIKSNKNVNKSFHITDNKNSSKNEFFEIIKGVHFCSTISSEENDCGKGEVFEFFSPIEGPTIVNLEYKDGKMILWDIKYPPPVCGNGEAEEYGGELCDDGNLNSGDGCSAECRNEYCGDGINTTSDPHGYYNSSTGIFPEQCDDANNNDMDACPSTCQNAFCGDGFIILGSESCDDQNAVPNDGCTNCSIDADYQCFGMPSVCSQMHEPGLWSKYYIKSSTYNVYNDMANVQYDVPFVSRVDETINIPSSSNWPGIETDSSLILISEGLFYAPVFGNYTFYLWSRSGSALFLFEEFFIDDNYNFHYGNESSNTIELDEGYVPIKIVMVRHGSYGGVKLRLSGPGYDYEIVPANLLSHIE